VPGECHASVTDRPEEVKSLPDAGLFSSGLPGGQGLRMMICLPPVMQAG